MADAVAPGNCSGSARRRLSRTALAHAFTLVELLVAMTVLAILVVLCFRMIQLTSNVWLSTKSKAEAFREARVGFDSMVDRLGTATLDQYLGYEYTLNSSGAAPIPKQFERRSELRFICGPAAQIVGSASHPTHAVFFTAPLGFSSDPTLARLSGLLNVCGYYIEWSNADPDRPPIIATPGQYRFRLMQFLQPTENMTLYAQTAAGYATYSPAVITGWQTAALAATPTAVRPLSDNVIALILLPCLNTTDTSGSLAPGFTYDSQSTNANPAVNQQNRLPPVLRVVLYSLDEASAQRLGQSATMPNLYGSLFQDPTKLYPANGDPGDLARFEATLNGAKLRFERHEIALSLLPQPWSTQAYQ